VHTDLPKAAGAGVQVAGQGIGEEMELQLPKVLLQPEFHHPAREETRLYELELHTALPPPRGRRHPYY